MLFYNYLRFIKNIYVPLQQLQIIRYVMVKLGL